MHSTVVVLPAPLGPMMPKISPRSTVNETSRTTVAPAYCLVSPWTSMAVVMCSPAIGSGLLTDRAGISGIAGVQPAHRDQAQPEVTNLGQQPVQCGLVRKQAGDDGLGTVAAELEAAEPVSPLVVQDAVDAALVAGGPL